MLYNLKRDTTKDPDGLTWEDIYPAAERKHKEMTDEEMLLAMTAFAKRHSVN